MSLVTRENVAGRGGWKVTPLGRVVRPVRMRPEHPLPPMQVDAKKKDTKKKDGDDKGDERKKRKKREKDPDSRARRRTIDPTKWGSTHLKGMFLDMEVVGMKKMDFSLNARYADQEGGSDESDSESEDEHRADEAATLEEPILIAPSPPVSPNTRTRTPSAEPIPPPALALQRFPSPQPPSLLPVNTDITLEKKQTLDFLASFFDGKDDSDWVGRESVGSDIDEEELTKGDVLHAQDAAGDEDFEVVPQDTSVRNATIASIDAEHDIVMDVDVLPVPVATPKPQTQQQKQVTNLKDLFAPREEEGTLTFHLTV